MQQMCIKHQAQAKDEIGINYPNLYYDVVYVCIVRALHRYSLFIIIFRIIITIQVEWHRNEQNIPAVMASHNRYTQISFGFFSSSSHNNKQCNVIYFLCHHLLAAYVFDCTFFSKKINYLPLYTFNNKKSSLFSFLHNRIAPYLSVVSYALCLSVQITIHLIHNYYTTIYCGIYVDDNDDIKY